MEVGEENGRHIFQHIMGELRLQKPEECSIARLKYIVFFVIDTSGSTAGAPIARINSAIPSCVEKLKKRQELEADYELQFAVLQFNNACNWVTGSTPLPIEDFTWKNLNSEGPGIISLAANELNAKMSRKALLNGFDYYYAPIVIILSDGATSSLDEDVYDSIVALQRNLWFAKSTKIAISISEIADAQLLYALVGDKNAIVTLPENAPLDEILYYCIKYAGNTDIDYLDRYKTNGGAVGSYVNDEFSLKPDDSLSYIVENEAVAYDVDDDWGSDR